MLGFGCIAATVTFLNAPAHATDLSPASALEAAVTAAATKADAAAFMDVRGCGLSVSTVAGVADRKTRTKATIDMPLRIASVSKLYAAATIFRLAERGLINLDQPVSTMLGADDAVGVAGREATLRQLLNHSGGVPDYYDLPDIRRWDWRLPLTPERVLTAIAKRPATGAPGARYAYSNSGYQLAALATERKVGTPFATLVQREVIAPLGVRDTLYREAAPGGTLHGYAGGKDWIDSAENTGPDGGITATLTDLRAALRAFFLDPGMLRAAGMEMTADPIETGKPRQQAGAGAEVRQSREGMLFVGHTGDVEGYLTFAYAAPDNDLTMIGHLSASEPATLAELLRATSSIVQAECTSK